MKQLNRVVFIHSAKIPYKELQLDGNVHFIGTQGVGKSTVQRAILFFYTANARREKMGIQSHQQSFMEYYFPHDNSYIIFEVSTQNEPFFVVLNRRSNTIRYLFVSGKYQQDFFIEQNTAFARNQMTNRIEKSGRLKSSIINSGAEYRDILYGKNRQYINFSLLRSKNYENIPRTLNNIFLNSGLDTASIKRTIIASVAENQHSVELQSHQKHLREFEERYIEIETFENNKPFAARMINLYQKIIRKREQAREIAENIGMAVLGNQKYHNDLEQVIAKIDEKINTIDEEYQTEEKKFQSQKTEFEQKSAVLNNKINETIAKQKDYKSQNIDALLLENERENEYINRLSTLQKEHAIMAAQFQEIEQKYTMLLQQAEIYVLQEIARFEKKLLNEKQKNQEKITDYSHRKTSKIEEINDAFAEIKETLQELVNELNSRKNILQIDIEKTKNKAFFEQEIQTAKQQQNNLHNKLKQAEKNLTNNQQQTENLLAKLKTNEREHEHDKKDAEHQFLPNITERQAKIAKLTTELEKLDSTFYNYLSNKVPNWQNTFGKVCSENLIFSDKYEIIETNQPNSNIFGIELDLSGLKNTYKTKDEYQSEKELHQKKLKETTAAYQKLLDENQNRFHKKQDAVNRDIRKLKAEKRELEHQIQNHKNRLTKTENDLLEYEKQTAQKRTEEIAKLSVETGKIESEIEKLRAQITQNRNEQNNQKAFIQQKFEEEIQKINNTINELTKTANEKIAELNNELKAEQTRIQEAKYTELQSGNTETEKLRSIENELEELKLKLLSIEQDKKLVFRYLEDKSALFDKLEIRKEQVQKLSENFGNVRTQWLDFQQKNTNIKNNLLHEKKETEKTFNEVKYQLKSYHENFTKSKVYSEYKAVIAQAQAPDKSLNISYITQNLLNIADELKTEEDVLFGNIQNYCGKFNEKNLFNFPVTFENKQQKEDFILYLQEYIQQDKISRDKTEAEKKFSLMTERISKQYEEFYNYRRNVENIVNRINKNFVSNQIFVGAIKEIQLRVSESLNAVIMAMKAIKEFVDNQNTSFITEGIFRSLNNAEINREATNLLREFQQAIKNAKKDNIEVEDSFELELRVVENDNDTGWLEKLSSVGSNGTDILVKALINISLLSIFIQKSTDDSGFKIHCVIDEVGVLHDKNINGLTNFANQRGINLINGSPNANDVRSYRHIYKFRKTPKNQTQIIKLLTINEPIND